jgi:hypothetical protein
MLGAGWNQESKFCSLGCSGEGESSQSCEMCVTLAILDAVAKLTAKGEEKSAPGILGVANPVVKGLSGSSVVVPDVNGRFVSWPSDWSALLSEKLRASTIAFTLCTLPFCPPLSKSLSRDWESRASNASNASRSSWLRSPNC